MSILQIVVALIGPTIAVCFGILNWRRKRFAWDIPAWMPMSSQRSVGRIFLTDSEASEEQLFVSLVSFFNIGNQPIEASDFERPLTILAAESTEFVDGTVLRSTPRQLKPALKSTPKQVTVEPLLLNPGDAFCLRLVMRGPGDFGFDYR